MDILDLSDEQVITAFTQGKDFVKDKDYYRRLTRLFSKRYIDYEDWLDNFYITEEGKKLLSI